MSISSDQSLVSENTRRATEETLRLLEEERKINTARNAFVNNIPSYTRLPTADGSRRSSRISRVRHGAETSSQPATPLTYKATIRNPPKSKQSQIQDRGPRQTPKYAKTPRPAHVPVFQNVKEEDEDDEKYEKQYLDSLERDSTPLTEQYGRGKRSAKRGENYTSKHDFNLFAVQRRISDGDEDNTYDVIPSVRRVNDPKVSQSDWSPSPEAVLLQQSPSRNERSSNLSTAKVTPIAPRTQPQSRSRHQSERPEQNASYQPGSRSSFSIRLDTELHSNEEPNSRPRNMAPKTAKSSLRFDLADLDERSSTPRREPGPKTPAASRPHLERKSRYSLVADRNDSMNSNIAVVDAQPYGAPPRRSPTQPTPPPAPRYTKSDAFFSFYIILILGIILSNLALSVYWGHYFAETGPPAPCDMTSSTKPFPDSWSDLFKIYRRPDISWDPVVRQQMQEFGKLVGADPWLMENCILPRNVMKLPLVTCQDRLPWYNLSIPQTLWLNERSGWGYSIDYDITEEFNTLFDMSFEFQELQTSWFLSDIGPSSGRVYERKRCKACAETQGRFDMKTRREPDWQHRDYQDRPSISGQEAVRKRTDGWEVNGTWFGGLKDEMVHRVKVLKSVAGRLPYWRRGVEHRNKAVHTDGRDGKWRPAASRYTETSTSSERRG